MAHKKFLQIQQFVCYVRDLGFSVCFWTLLGVACCYFVCWMGKASCLSQQDVLIPLCFTWTLIIQILMLHTRCYVRDNDFNSIFQIFQRITERCQTTMLQNGLCLSANNHRSKYCPSNAKYLRKYFIKAILAMLWRICLASQKTETVWFSPQLF